MQLSSRNCFGEHIGELVPWVIRMCTNMVKTYAPGNEVPGEQLNVVKLFTNLVRSFPVAVRRPARCNAIEVQVALCSPKHRGELDGPEHCGRQGNLLRAKSRILGGRPDGSNIAVEGLPKCSSSSSSSSSWSSGSL